MIKANGADIARIRGEGAMITDTQSALDLIATVCFESGSTRIVLDKAGIGEDFFRLATGFAGEITQKFVNYGCKLAIVGDFSAYTSPALKAFMLESNRGGHLFFVETEEEAAEKLTRA